MGNVLNSKSIVFLIGLLTTLSAAEAENLTEISKDQIKELDTQIQDIKYEALEISTGIARLEEKINFPANTQISIFLSVANGEQFYLEKVELKIDGKEIISYVYTPIELEALQRGGVQRIYTGNILAGEHALEVSSVGQSTSKKGYRQNVTHKFLKMDSTELIEITLAGPAYGNQGVVIKN